MPGGTGWWWEGDPPFNGIRGDMTRLSIPELMLVAASNGIALYNFLVMAILIPLGFKRRAGWYYWSLTISCWGVLFHSAGCICLFFSQPVLRKTSAGFMVFGWMMMVSGQAVVLWSRLNLLDLDRKHYMPFLYGVLCWSLALHIPTAKFQFDVVAQDSDRWRDWLIEFTIMDKIQTVGFCVQEFIISGFWIYRVRNLVNRKKTLAAQLAVINVIIIIGDVAVVAVNFNCSYALGVSLKSMVYSIKVMLEFAVLGNLKSASAYQVANAGSPSAVGYGNRRKSDTSGVRSFFNLFGLQNRLTKHLSNSSQATTVGQGPALPSDNLSRSRSTAQHGEEGTSEAQSIQNPSLQIQSPIKFGMWESRFNKNATDGVTAANAATMVNNPAGFTEYKYPKRPRLDALDPHNLTQVTPKSSMNSLRSRILRRSPKTGSARSSLRELPLSASASIASMSRQGSPQRHLGFSLTRVIEQRPDAHIVRSSSCGSKPTAGPSSIVPRIKVQRPSVSGSAIAVENRGGQDVSMTPGDEFDNDYNATYGRKSLQEIADISRSGSPSANTPIFAPNDESHDIEAGIPRGRPKKRVTRA